MGHGIPARDLSHVNLVFEGLLRQQVEPAAVNAEEVDRISAFRRLLELKPKLVGFAVLEIDFLSELLGTGGLADV